MQTGDRIFGKSGTEYVIIKPLGKPGLFGQAFVCEAKGEAQKEKAVVVVKTLRPERSANPEDRDRFFAEARTLEAVAAVEERNTVHYAVRLLDESPADAPEPFIILEQATGKNVLNDLIEGVVDWDYAPLPETLALDIASHFARALSHTHQAGYCYDDMKLDNLFWRADQPGDPLRIIDWNVTSPVGERGVVSDWKRFAARLYELYTGQHITISREGLVMGNGPGGPRWQRLPDGIRDIIEKGLAGHYQNDDVLLRDVQREREQVGMGWEQLLEKARIANGNNLIIEVLAPVWRAEPQIADLDREDPKRKPALDQCADLREQAGARRGTASDKRIASAIKIMREGNAPVASEQFERVYRDAKSQDPRPRRWFWLARLAVDTPDVYRNFRDDLEKAVEALNQGDIGTARTHLGIVAHALPEQLPDQVNWLTVEAETRFSSDTGELNKALEQIDQIVHLFNQYPDLYAFKEELEHRREMQQKQRAAYEREQHLLSTLKDHLDQGKKQLEKNNVDEAEKRGRKAEEILRLLQGEECLPETEQQVKEAVSTLPAIWKEIHTRREQTHQLLQEQLLLQPSYPPTSHSDAPFSHIPPPRAKNAPPEPIPTRISSPKPSAPPPSNRSSRVPSPLLAILIIALVGLVILVIFWHNAVTPSSTDHSPTPTRQKTSGVITLTDISTQGETEVAETVVVTATSTPTETPSPIVTPSPTPSHVVMKLADLTGYKTEHPDDFSKEGQDGSGSVALFLWKDQGQKNKVTIEGNNKKVPVLLQPGDGVEIVEEQGEYSSIRIVYSNVNHDFIGQQGWIRTRYIKESE